jgi:hypothetical protein
MEPFTIAGILLLKYATAHGLFAAAGVGAAGLAAAAVIYAIVLAFSTVLTWFRTTLNNIKTRKASNFSPAALTALVGVTDSNTKTINAGLELITGRSSTTYETRYLLKIVKDSITDEVIETEIHEFRSLDEELMDAHRSDAIVLWT